jgi:hypothetical protein
MPNNIKTLKENNMSNSKQTRYAVIARSTGKTLKNASTREQAREWKRSSGKSGLAIFDRMSNAVIS